MSRSWRLHYFVGQQDRRATREVAATRSEISPMPDRDKDELARALEGLASGQADPHDTSHDTAQGESDHVHLSGLTNRADAPPPAPAPPATTPRPAGTAPKSPQPSPPARVRPPAP